jgi:hypothetical protein
MDLNVVKVKWNHEQDPYVSNAWWNETCALIMERFGLPGDRYNTCVTENYMDFIFNDQKDATMCRLFLSERL